MKSVLPGLRHVKAGGDSVSQEHKPWRSVWLDREMEQERRKSKKM